MKIFITGASGFIGGAIARKLATEHEVYGMARSAASAGKIRELGASPVQCSMESITVSHLKGMDVVIHCAAFVENWGTPQQFHQGNVVGTRRVVEAAKAAHVPRFIYIGTEAALFYGQDMIDIDESYPYPEHSPFLYSETKRQAEILALEANAPGFEVLSIRPRLVWGPGDTTILPNLLKMVDTGKFRWIDAGQAKTSSVHIDNLVEGVRCALTRGRGGEAYFITDWEVNTFRDFLGMLLEAAGRNPGNKNAPGWLVRGAAWVMEKAWRGFGLESAPPVTRFSAAIMSRTCTIASSKAEKELGYHPVISVKAGMQGLKTLLAQ